MKELAIKISQHSFFRYLIIACVIVVIEVASFQLLYILGVNYLVATVLSMGVGIILNWIASRLFVFKASKYSRKMEFTLVLLASLVGVGIQTVTTYISVEIFLLAPIIGKLLAIGITFFWNYFLRSRFIFAK